MVTSEILKPVQNDKGGTLRLPPQNLEMERYVLGAILLDNEALAKALEILSGPHDFYKLAHRKIYEAMIELYEKDSPIDLMILAEKLRQKEELEDVGGVDYLADLVDMIPTAANIRAHAKIVREKAIARSMIQHGQNGVATAFEDLTPVADQIDKTLTAFLKLSQGKNETTLTHTKEFLKPSIEIIESAYDNKSLITGVPTGFADIDEKTAGLQKSDLIIIAGRPSMGKTALAINMAENLCALRCESVVAIFSLEMSTEQLVLRMLCSEARVSGHKLRTGYLAQSDWPKLTMAAGKLHDRNIYIDDSPATSALDIRAKCRKLMIEAGRIDLVIVDYLQLMSSRSKSDSRVQEVSEITRSLKQLAKELKVPLVALSQLSRKCEERNDKRPQLSDLRDSGSIEQDADVVMFVYRDEFYYPDKLDALGKADVIIGKQRNGPLGTIELAFIKEITKFENLSGDTNYE